MADACNVADDEDTGTTGRVNPSKANVSAAVIEDSSTCSFVVAMVVVGSRRVLASRTRVPTAFPVVPMVVGDAGSRMVLVSRMRVSTDSVVDGDSLLILSDDDDEEESLDEELREEEDDDDELLDDDELNEEEDDL